jgi:hypothetical protein
MKHFLILLSLSYFSIAPARAQSGAQTVQLRSLPARHQVDVIIGGKPFTKYFYPDSLEKPILYPLHTASGHTVTRGFPIAPRPGERTDHPHQVGLWFTYENVNGLDFWNNSYAIPREKKSHYGWIRQQKILSIKNGKKGVLKISALWENQQGDVLLKELTTFTFSGNTHQRVIDRTTTLTAATTVTFKDVKDGLIGIRVARALELPSTPQRERSAGSKGPLRETPSPANGNYLTSEGKTGDRAWGSRARWCMLYGRQGGEMESITIFDHPGNPGYPTFWHARGYGLFAANPLGEKIFTHGEKSMNLRLAPGQSVTFRYRILITDGAGAPQSKTLDKMADHFADTED